MPHPNDTSLGSKEKRQQTTEHYLSSNDEFQTAIVHQSRATMNENRARALLLRGESLNNKPQLTKTRSYADKLILHNHCSFIGQSHTNCSTSAKILSVNFLPPPRPRLPSFGHREVPSGGGFYLKLFLYGTGARRNS